MGTQEDMVLETTSGFQWTLSTSVRNGLSCHSGQMFLGSMLPQSHMSFSGLLDLGSLHSAQRDLARQIDTA